MNSTFLWMVSVANRWKKSAAVTVQKSAHRILLYSFMHDPSQSPPPPLPGSLYTCPQGCSGPGKCLAFTESTTQALVPSLRRRADLHRSIFSFSGSPRPSSLIHPPLSGDFVPLFAASSFFFLLFLSVSVTWCRGHWRRRVSGERRFSHSLMSWVSNILARVFLTLRAVRREAGL